MLALSRERKTAVKRYILIGQEGYEVLKKHLPKAESPKQQCLWAGIQIRIDPYIYSTDIPNEFDTPWGIQHRDTFSIRYRFLSYDANDIDYLLYAGIIRRRRDHPAYIINEQEQALQGIRTRQEKLSPKLLGEDFLQPIFKFAGVSIG